jgi:phage shock protein A
MNGRVFILAMYLQRNSLQQELSTLKEQLEKANEALARQPLEEAHSYETVVRRVCAGLETKRNAVLSLRRLLLR